MQMYANLFKINEPASFPGFWSWFCFRLLLLFFSSEKSRWGFRKSLFMHLTSNDFKINDNSTFWYPRRFWFCIFYLLDPVGACKLLHRIVKFIAQMYSLDQWKRYFYCSIPFFFSIVWYIICIRIEGVSEISN